MPMQTNVFAKEVGVTNGKLHLLSLYGDLPASVRARWAAGAIARLAPWSKANPPLTPAGPSYSTGRAGPLWKTTSEMWKIDSLQVSAPIREMITNDAANADVIIVAASSLAHSEPVLIQWLESLKDCKGNRPVTGLLGDEETTTVDLDGVVKPLLHCAQQTDRNFIWHLMETGAMNDSDWLAEGVNELLSRKSAAHGSPRGVGAGRVDEGVSGITPGGEAVFC
jgi:hypothetical protein